MRRQAYLISYHFRTNWEEHRSELVETTTPTVTQPRKFGIFNTTLLYLNTQTIIYSGNRAFISSINTKIGMCIYKYKVDETDDI